MPRITSFRSGFHLPGVCAVGVLLPICAPGAVAAQGEGRVSMIEEVVVTAQRREQDAQDIPVSVTAFSGDMVESFGFDTVFEIQDQVPNFSMGGLGTTQNTPIPYLNIRGVQFRDYAVVNDASVSLYLNDVYQAAPGAGSAQMFDVERIEVLKGPQGSLFGRNTSAGLVQVITRAPTDTPDGYLAVQYGRFDQRIAEAAYGGPITDNVRFRVAGKYNEDDGYRQDSPVSDLDDLGKTDARAVRGTLEVDATERLSFVAGAHYSESDGIFPGRYRYGTKDPVTGEQCDRERIEQHLCVTGTGFRIPDDDPTEHYEYARTPMTYDSGGGRLQVNWAGDWGEITSITGYDEFDFRLRQDTGLGPHSSFNVTGEYWSEVESFSQEIRISGSDDRVSWITGLYYYDDRRDLRNRTYFFYPVEVTLRDRVARLDTDSFGVFGHVEARISDRVSLAVGGRYTNETRDLRFIRDLNDPDFFLSDDVDFNNFTGDIAVSWDIKDNVLGYAKLSRGSKNGGYTISSNTMEENGPASEEILDAVEIGLKGDWFDNRLRTNIALFYYDFAGYQATASRVEPDGSLVSTFFNAGDAKIKGAEFEITAMPTPNLEFVLGVGLLDGKLETEPNILVNGFTIDGNDTPQSPDYSLNALVRYTIPTARMGTFTLQADGRYQDDIWFDVDADPFEREDAYGIANFRVFWDSPEYRYSAMAFVTNAFDEVYTTGAYHGGDAGAADTAWKEIGAPRTWGLRVRYNFH